MKYYSIHKFSKLIGRTSQTLRNWDRSGRLKPHHTGPSGYRYYSSQQLNEVLGVPELPKIVLGYCRVENRQQKEELMRQVRGMQAYLGSLGSEYEIIRDIGSAVGYENEGFRTVLRRISNKEVSKLVVFSRDRLLRFGFELVELMANMNGCTIVVLSGEEKPDQGELVRDLVQIVTELGAGLDDARAESVRRLVGELSGELSGEP